MIERHELALSIDDDPDGVEAKVGREGTALFTHEVRRRHPANLRLLARMQRVPGTPRSGSPCLDLAEDEEMIRADHEIELAEPGPVVVGEDAKAKPFEVLGGKLLAAAAEEVAEVSGHAHDAKGDPCHKSAPACDERSTGL